MKKIIFNSFLMLLLILTGCDSDDGGTGGGSGGGSGGGTQPPEVIEIIQMTVNTSTRDFDQDGFIQALSNDLGIDSSRIIVLNLVEQDTAVIIELLFLESDDPNDTSVNDLMNTAQGLTDIGDGAYSVTVEVVELDECDSAQASIQEANAMLAYVSNQVYQCDLGNEDACYSDDPDDWPFNTIYEKYETALAYGNNCSSASEAHFGMGVLSMFTATQDPILINILESWIEWDEDSGYFDGDRNNGSRMRSGLPISITDLMSVSNIDFRHYVPFQFVLKALDNTMNTNSDRDASAPNMTDLQIIAESVLIPKITNAINHFESAVNNNVIFTITPEMQNDEYQSPVELDDAEIYVMKAFMHQLRAMLYVFSTYNFDFICGDDGPGDFDSDACNFDLMQFDQNGDYLSIRSGAQSYFPSAFNDLNAIFTSAQGAYNFVMGAPYHENGVLTSAQIDEHNSNSDETMQTSLFTTGPNYLNQTQNDVEMCTDSWWEYLGEECDYYYDWYFGDGWYDCYDNYEYHEGDCYYKQVSLANFMQNPIQDWKDIFPPYTLTSGYDYETDEDHEETTNYNFNDGCYNNTGPSTTTSSDTYYTDSIYWGTSAEFYPFSHLNYEWEWDCDLPHDFSLNSGELVISIENISDEDMNENDYFEILAYYMGHYYIYYDDLVWDNFGYGSVTKTFDFENINNGCLWIEVWNSSINDNNFYPNGSISITLNLDYSFSPEYPALVYEYMSLDCYLGNHVDENGNEIYGYGCNNNDYECEWYGINCPDENNYPSEFSNGELLCNEWDTYGYISCDCSESESFVNQVFDNMIADIELSKIHYARMQYFPEGSWNMDEPHWDYDLFYLDQYIDPCLTWEADNYSSWQSGWSDFTLNGLFPDMTLNEFFNLAGIEMEGWEHSNCEEDER